MNAKFLFPAAILLLFCGCASTSEEDTIADLSLDEIELRKTRATDPEGRYARARTSIIRQEVCTPTGWLDPDIVQMVEVKFEEPGNFKVTTFDDNAPAHAIIINDQQAWIADYNSEIVGTIPHEQLEKVRILQRISQPDTLLKDVFSQIEVSKCKDEENQYYKLTCSNPGMNPIELYIDAHDFLPRKLSGVFNLNGNNVRYESQVIRYGMHEGVRIPEETLIIQNGLRQNAKLIYFKLDIPIASADFRPPVF